MYEKAEIRCKLSKLSIEPLNTTSDVLMMYLVLAHLFVKIPLPVDSEGSFSVFESICHLLLPV